MMIVLVLVYIVCVFNRANFHNSWTDFKATYNQVKNMPEVDLSRIQWYNFQKTDSLMWTKSWAKLVNNIKPLSRNINLF